MPGKTIQVRCDDQVRATHINLRNRNFYMATDIKEGNPPARAPGRFRPAARLCRNFFRDAWQHPLTSIGLLLIAVRLAMILTAYFKADAPLASLLIVLISLLLGAPASPLYHSTYWLWFTVFVGANLFQSGLTGWCLMDKILKKAGVPE